MLSALLIYLAIAGSANTATEARVQESGDLEVSTIFRIWKLPLHSGFTDLGVHWVGRDSHGL